MKRFLLLLFAGAVYAVDFQDVTSAVGLIEPLKGMQSHAIAWGYLNADAYPDLFVGTFSDDLADVYNKRGHTTGAEPNKIFINKGGTTFEEVLNSPVNLKGQCSFGTFVDFDNNGVMDLITTFNAINFGIYRPNSQTSNHLFRNTGNGLLTDITTASNLSFAIPATARNAFVLDYNGDGYLDIFLQEDCVLAQSSGNSRLMKNTNGGFVFQDVTASAGFPVGSRKSAYGLGGFVADVNNDTWPDLYFPHGDVLCINNKNGTFTIKNNVFFAASFAVCADANPNWPCGADVGDLDGDGDLDLVIGEHYSASSSHAIRAFLNDGNDNSGSPIYREITATAGFKSIGVREPHIVIQDFDNDGRPDILVSAREACLYVNTGTSAGVPRFAAPTSMPVGGLGYWPAIGVCDYDIDGRLDLMTSEWDPATPSQLFRNVTSSINNWLAIDLDIAGSKNRNGIGAMVRIYKPGKVGQKASLLGIQCLSVANGYSTGSMPRAHFGIPSDSEVDGEVTMPCSGPVIVARNVRRNQVYTITKNEPGTGIGHRLGFTNRSKGVRDRIGTSALVYTTAGRLVRMSQIEGQVGIFVTRSPEMNGKSLQIHSPLFR